MGVDVACVYHFVACVRLVMFCWLCLLVLSVCQAVHGFHVMALYGSFFDLFYGWRLETCLSILDV